MKRYLKRAALLIFCLGYLPFLWFGVTFYLDFLQASNDPNYALNNSFPADDLLWLALLLGKIGAIWFMLVLSYFCWRVTKLSQKPHPQPAQ